MVLYLVPWFFTSVFREAFLYSPIDVLFSHVEQVLSLLFGLVYLLTSYRILKNTQRNYASHKEEVPHWLLRFFLGMLVLFSVCGITIFFNFWIFDLGIATVTYNTLWITIALTLAWLGIEVIANPSSF